MLKNILKAIIWPVIFIIGQIFITFIFTYAFNNQYQTSLEQKFPDLSNTEIIEKLTQSIKTETYQNELNQFLNQYALIIVLISAIMFLPIFIKKYKKIKEKKPIIIPTKKMVDIAIISIILSLSLNTILYLLNLKFSFTTRYDNIDWTLSIFISTAIIGPILEEFLFRGIVYNKLKINFKPKQALWITTIIFSLLHREPSQILYAFIVGLFLNTIYEKTQDIKIPIMAHIIINMVTIICLPLIINNTILVMIIIILLLTYIILKKSNFKNSFKK